MWVKICANTSAADALVAVEAGADAVGFVFASSQRRVTAEQVRAITAALPAAIEKVGVFASDNWREVEECVRSCGLTAAQLHRPLDAEMVVRLARAFGGELKIIQTVAYAVDSADRAAADAAFAETVRVAAQQPAVWAVLVDAAKSGLSGGLGVAFDWEHVGGLTRAAMPGSDKKVVLAGGLRPENVAEAAKAFGAWGVDVASGVEASVGRKSAEKVRAFVRAARENC